MDGVRRVFRGLADTRVPLRASAVAAVVNLVLDPLFVFEPLNWGDAGAAVATAASCVAACFVLIRSLKPRLDALAVRKSQTVELTTDAAAERAANRAVAGTSAATLLRTSSILGYWVFVAAGVGAARAGGDRGAWRRARTARAAPRRAARPLLARAARRLSHPSPLSPAAAALSPPPSPPSPQVWLLFVPLVRSAGRRRARSLCARRLAEGADERARLLLLRLLRISLMLGVFAGAGIGLIGAPLARASCRVTGDDATATRLFGWAALGAARVPHRAPRGVAAGRRPLRAFLASMTLANALSLGAGTHLALRSTPRPDDGVGLHHLVLRAARHHRRPPPLQPRRRLRLQRVGFGRGDPTLPRELGGAQPDAADASGRPRRRPVLNAIAVAA